MLTFACFLVSSGGQGCSEDKALLRASPCPSVLVCSKSRLCLSSQDCLSRHMLGAPTDLAPGNLKRGAEDFLLPLHKQRLVRTQCVFFEDPLPHFLKSVLFASLPSTCLICNNCIGSSVYNSARQCEQVQAALNLSSAYGQMVKVVLRLLVPRVCIDCEFL